MVRTKSQSRFPIHIRTKSILKNSLSFNMPEISRFLGIIIAMYYRDHEPAHFHAIYGNYEAVFAIEDLRIIEGKLPSRVTSLVVEWAALHIVELEKDWELCKKQLPLKKIKPLV
jgi:hypothetical protein